MHACTDMMRRCPRGTGARSAPLTDGQAISTPCTYHPPTLMQAEVCRTDCMLNASGRRMGPSMLTPSSNVWNRGDSRQSHSPHGRTPPASAQRPRTLGEPSDRPVVSRDHVRRCISTHVVVTDWLYSYDATYSRCSLTARQRSAKEDSSSRAGALPSQMLSHCHCRGDLVLQSEQIPGRRHRRLLETMHGAF
jgi:hypothetical protein